MSYLVAGMLCRLAAGLALGLQAGGPTPAAEEADAVKVLSSAGFKTDTPSLLALFRSRTLSAADLTRLEAAVRRLGDSSYEVRTQASADLVAAGMPALRFLQPALADPDLEIARRAERCTEAIQRGPGTLIPVTAARLLALRKPAGAAEALLEYVPFADDESVEDAVFAALLAVALRDGQPEAVLVKALDNPEPGRRAAAAHVLGQADAAALRRLVHRLLDDPVLRVRFQAAQALLTHGDKSAVLPLIRLLTDSPPELAWQAEDLLGRLAGTDGPGVFLDNTSADSRRQCRSAWENWWKAHEANFEPGRLKLEPRYLGLTLIGDLDRGRIFELGPDRKQRWEITGLSGPVDVQLLANGHILTAENHARKLTERDKSGKVVWEKSTPAYPASCQRLPNGNTFIATYNQIFEVSSSGKELFALPRPEGIYCARKLRNGHIVLLSSSGRVVTLDSAGKEIKRFEAGTIISWSSLDVLANGNILACCAPGKVVEFDQTGKRVWECAVPNAVCARRLPNGNTLVCSSEGKRVVEMSRAGKELWEYRTEGRPWHVRFR
jgi:hypothetical protein